MNKRQAKIEALYCVVEMLAASSVWDTLCDFDIELDDLIKVEKEYTSLEDGLRKRLARLEGSGEKT